MLKGSVNPSDLFLLLMGGLRLPYLPTVQPKQATEVWNNNGVLMIGDSGMDTIVQAVIDALPKYNGEVE